jgi:co-chaperonin GroES (HSP10)
VKFQVESGNEVVFDFKTMSKVAFLDKYDFSAEKYESLRTSFTAAPETLNAQDFDIPLRPVEGKPSTVAAREFTKPKIIVKTIEKVRYSGKPLGDEVLVIKTEREHSSQLIIPDSAKTKEGIGFIVSHGPEAVRAIAAGGVKALVIFDQFAAYGKEIELVDEQGIPRQHLLLKDCDVQLRLERITPQPPLA